MLCLFETPAGFALFKVLDQSKLSDVPQLWQEFETAKKASKVVKLKAFTKFDNTADALAAAANLVDSKVPKQLKKFLKKNCGDDKLAVVDAKLGKAIANKLGLEVTSGSDVLELTRGIRSQMDALVTSLDQAAVTQMSLGLSHSLSRYKLKFSPDKIDTMVVQAIGLLDDLDKELNTYAMRVREWYGWHFPEMTKLIDNNITYAKAVKFMGSREKAADLDFSGILEEEVEASVKEASVVSMGTEISPDDLDNLGSLCDQVIELSEYRAQLYEYLKNRMQAIAPNLTILVGELVGARLIAHAGTLMNLAKAPASTVQILGAEKALFRALKTKHATPKYGLIFHASLIGQASPKNKGKISRVLAAKCALAVRVDALGESEDVQLGIESRAKGEVQIEARLRQLEGRALEGEAVVVPARGPAKYDSSKPDGGALASAPATYNTGADVAMDDAADKAEKKKKKKRAAEEMEQEVVENGDDKKKNRKSSEGDDTKAKKKKKRKSSEPDEAEDDEKKAKKKKKRKSLDAE